MSETFALALGIAASPFPVIPAILLLFTSRPRPTALAFLGGWFAGIALVTGVCVALADLIDVADDSPTWLSWVRVVVGVVLVLYGVRTWSTRHASADLPPWMRTIQNASPRTAVRLALLLSVANPKVVLLAAAGGFDIGASDLAPTGEILAVIAFTVVASISVAIPVVMFVVVGDSVLPVLAKARDWLMRNNAVVMAVVITVIGLVLVTNGISEL